MFGYFFETEFGKIYLKGDKDFLYSIDFIPFQDIEIIETPLFLEAKRQLCAYFNGNLKVFNLPYKLNLTPFQNKVLEAVSKIPFSKTKSYFEIAQETGNKRAYRAVGSSCNKNPLLILIPCHRVISSNGKLNGYRGGISLKEKLLKLEGAL